MHENSVLISEKTTMHAVAFELLMLLSVAGLPVSDYSVRSSSGLSEEAHRD